MRLDVESWYWCLITIGCSRILTLIHDLKFMVNIFFKFRALFQVLHCRMLSVRCYIEKYHMAGITKEYCDTCDSCDTVILGLSLFLIYILLHHKRILWFLWFLWFCDSCHNIILLFFDIFLPHFLIIIIGFYLLLL